MYSICEQYCFVLCGLTSAVQRNEAEPDSRAGYNSQAKILLGNTSSNFDASCSFIVIDDTGSPGPSPNCIHTKVNYLSYFVTML